MHGGFGGKHLYIFLNFIVKICIVLKFDVHIVFWQVWAVEHSNILLGSHRPPFMYPRLLRWSNAKFPRKVDVIAKVMKNLQKFQV